MASPARIDSYKEAEALEYAHCMRDLGLYTQAAWDVLEPQTDLKWNWHHDLICEHLQACAIGQIKRLIINVAPRSTKSILASVSFPTWVWPHDPATRFLFGSFSDKLSTKHSVLRRNLIESDWYRRGFGHRFKLSQDVNTKSEFTNNCTGQMRAGGIKSPPTGEGGDYIIIDDPHNPKGAESEAERESAIEQFDLGWSSRLNNKKTGRIIVIMQRLHEKDLTGHLLKKQGYEHLKIPTIAEDRERMVFPITKSYVDREAGDLMHPERDGPEEIAQAKRELGPYGFSGQHQQEPTPRSGGLFKESMFDYVKLPAAFDYRFITADTAYSEKKENDFTVFTAFGVLAGELYVLDVYREQINADKIEAAVMPFIKRYSDYGFRYCWIEPKGHGIYLNQALPKKGVMIPSEDDRKEFYTDRKWDKVARANNAVPHLANRKVHMNEAMANKEELVSEALRFPKGAHDDFVDTLVDGIKLVFARQVGILDVL